MADREHMIKLAKEILKTTTDADLIEAIKYFISDEIIEPIK